MCNVQNPNKDSFNFCNALCLGKAHRLPSHTSMTANTKPLKSIFFDLWAPALVTSSYGFTYFITCVDVYNRYTWIYPLKLKSRTLTIFKQFQILVELQLNHKSKVIHTDGGRELGPFTQYLTSLGISHRLTCIHTHHQNGPVERKYRHILENWPHFTSSRWSPTSLLGSCFLNTSIYR